MESSKSQLLVCCVVWACLLPEFAISGASDTIVHLPTRFKSEGRVTLSLTQNDKTAKHHLAFSEVTDSLAKRSTLKIGFVSYRPVSYFTRRDLPTIYEQDGQCGLVKTKTNFVPSLDWFAKLMFTEGIVAKLMSGAPHLVGPSGLLLLLDKLRQGSPAVHKGEQVHRNVLCDVYTSLITLAGQTYSIEVDVYLVSRSPTDEEPKRESTTYFSVSARTRSRGEPEAREASLTIDYYVLDAIPDGGRELDELEGEFNLPLGIGCGEFVGRVSPQVKTQSFSMVAFQWSSHDNILMAFDHQSNLIRREVVDESVRIWDLKEDLLYYSDATLSSSSPKELAGRLKTCSVLSVNSEYLGPAYRPFADIHQEGGVLKFMGLEEMAFMGRGEARDLPCLVFESIVDQIPAIFSSSQAHSGVRKEPGTDYIVQLYVLRGDQPEFGRVPELNDKLFSPVRMSLYRRVGDGQIDHIDLFDIFDFHWSLEGWPKKSGELFQAPECFSEETERRQVELVLKYDKVHSGVANDDDINSLTHNRFRLEHNIIRKLVDLYKISPMHLIEYEMEFKRHHIGMSLTFADRHEERSLRFVVNGHIGAELHADAFKLDFLGEEHCVLSASLVDQATTIAHCPATDSTPQSCTVYLGASDPPIESSQDGTGECQIYRLEEIKGPSSASGIIDEHSYELVGLRVDFEVSELYKEEVENFRGQVEHYDVSHAFRLLIIDRYMFALDENQKATAESKLIRSFSSIHYSSQEDCGKICNLDTNCRSYSFCSGGSATPCILSSLDLRAANVTSQLMWAKPLDSARADAFLVRDNSDNSYELRLAKGCRVFEKNYLKSFSETYETVRVDPSVARLITPTKSAFECAKRAVDLESDLSQDQHVAMFAYCSAHKRCLIDEQLLGSARDSLVPADDDNGDNLALDYEIACRLYRRRYQTYFHVSAPVLAKQPEQQLELATSSLEECARACWNQFGQSCASFDFCAPSGCSINRRSVNSSGVSTELKQDCLHYERDLGLDELRREHLVGRHQLLEVRQTGSFGLLFWLLSVLAFLGGVYLGELLEDRSRLALRAAQLVGSRPNEVGKREVGRAEARANYRAGSSSIQLSVMRRAPSELERPLEEDFFE